MTVSSKTQYRIRALERIKSEAHLLSASSDEKVTRAAFDIFWLAVAGLEERDKASALETMSQLSGCSTDSPERLLRDDEGAKKSLAEARMCMGRQKKMGKDGQISYLKQELMEAKKKIIELEKELKDTREWSDYLEANADNDVLMAW